MEAVFQAGKFSGGKRSEVAGIIPQFSCPQYCFSFPSISEAFLPETVSFSELSDRLWGSESSSWAGSSQLNFLFLISLIKNKPNLFL
jgi:hypothetical protein